MLKLAWRNIQFRKMRAVLTALGIATSVMLVVIMSAIMKGTEQSLIDSFGNLAGQIRVQPKSNALAGQSTDLVPAGIFLTREETEEVLAAATGADPAVSSPIISQMLIPPVGPNQPAQVTLNGVLPGREGAAIGSGATERGEAKLQGERDVILGYGAHKYFSDQAGKSLMVGDTVVLPGAGEFTLAAVLKKRDPMTDGLAVIALSTAQSALKRGDTVNYVALGYKVDQVKAVAEELKVRLPDLEVVTPDAMLEAAEKALSGQKWFFSVINNTAYLTATMIIFMVMYTSVMERTKEIGTMRAVGAPRSAIIGGVLLEALLFTLAGGVIGSAGGWAVMHGWEFLTTGQLLFGALQAVAIALLIALLSALYPAIRAARVNPLEALRYE